MQVGSSGGLAAALRARVQFRFEQTINSAVVVFERGLLEWIGKGPSDSGQFYRIPR